MFWTDFSLDVLYIAAMNKAPIKTIKTKKRINKNNPNRHQYQAINDNLLFLLPTIF